MGIGARFFNEVEGAFSIPILPKAVDLTFNQPSNDRNAGCAAIGQNYRNRWDGRQPAG